MTTDSQRAELKALSERMTELTDRQDALTSRTDRAAH